MLWVVFLGKLAPTTSENLKTYRLDQMRPADRYRAHRDKRPPSRNKTSRRNPYIALLRGLSVVHARKTGFALRIGDKRLANLIEEVVACQEAAVDP